MLFLERALFRQRMSSGENRILEIGELLFAGCQSLSCFGEHAFTFQHAVLGLQCLLAQHLNSLFTLGGVNLPLGRGGFQRRMPLLKRGGRLLFAVQLSVQFGGGAFEFRLLLRVGRKLRVERRDARFRLPQILVGSVQRLEDSFEL